MPEHARVARTTRTAPVYPRRVSGPSRPRPALAGAAIPRRGRTGTFEKLSRFADHRLVDGLLRSRGCILLIGLMLGGIVAMQVSLLRLNSGISRAVQTQDTLVRQNMALQSGIAELTSGERISAAATTLGMVDPPAGETRYLQARPDRDAARAVKRMKPQSPRAAAIMDNGGRVPGALAEPGSAAAALAASLNGEVPPAGTTTTPGTTTTTTPGTTTAPETTTTTTPPTATATPPAVAATPVPDATQIPTAPPATTAPGTGADAALEG